MKTTHTLFFLFLFKFGFSQTLSLDTGTTRAVIVGISDYQDEGIPDLQFAHRDANAMVAYLQSKAGGEIPNDQMKILLNKEATTAQIVAAFDWLLMQTKEGDQCIIYFSGHGDVEVKTRSQLGFLLTWDSPAQSYMAGAYPLFYLQDVIATLSLDKNAKVMLITDACRSGKLAGDAIGGAKLTNSNLAKQYGSEIKILSCQPDEYSAEGEQWGGGRGVFSYYLLEGLYGLADNNEDLQINLLEIERYLIDHVLPDVAPASQIPMAVGSKGERIAWVDNESLVRIKQEHQNPPVGDLAFKGILSEEDLVAALTPRLKTMYTSFQDILKEKLALESADSIYQLMIKEEGLTNLQPTIKRQYAAALQDEVQQALNALLESDPSESNKFYYNPEKYYIYPDYIQRSMDLLGADHYLIPSLQAKKYYFEANNIIRSFSESDEYDKAIRDSMRILPAQLIDSAIALQPEAAYLYFSKGFIYSFRVPSMIDSILYYEQKAIELSPQWLLPYLTIAGEYQFNLQDLVKAEEWLLKARDIHPKAFVVLEKLTWLYQGLGKSDKALETAKSMVESRPELFNSHGNLGSTYFQMKNYPEALKSLEKAFELDDHPRTFVPQYLGFVYMATRQQTKGISFYEKILADERTPYWMKARFYTWYGKGILNYNHDFEKAKELLTEAFQLLHFPQDLLEIMVWQAKAELEQGHKEEAHQLLDQALSNDSLYVNAFILAYALKGELAYQAGNMQVAEDFFKKGADYPGDNYFKEEALYRYGTFLIAENRLEEAKKQFESCNWITNNQGYYGYYGMALLAAKQEDTVLALQHLEWALDRFYPIKEPILSEPMFEEIRRAKEFKVLMEKHF